MNKNCNHNDNHSIVCKTCKCLLCTGCAIDNNNHCRHKLITFVKIIQNHVKETNNKRTVCESTIASASTKLQLLLNKKDKLSNVDSDDSLILLLVNSTTTTCQKHGSASEVVCVTCKSCICTKCFVEMTHSNHDVKFFADYANLLRLEANSKLAQLQTEIENCKQIIQFNRATLDSCTDSLPTNTIIEQYLALNNINRESSMIKSVPKINKIYDLESATKKNLRWNHKYKLITNNCTHILKPGYYMTIAVGGGGSGGGFLKYSQLSNNCTVPGTTKNIRSIEGGGSGYITANLLKITQDVALNIVIGAGGQYPLWAKSCYINDYEIFKKYDYYNLDLAGKSEYDSIANGKPTIIEFDNTKITADGGTGPIFGADSQMWGGRGFSGGGSCGGFGGTNGSNGLADKFIASQKYGINFNIENYLTNPNAANGSGSTILDTVSDIFPLVYPGLGGVNCTDKVLLNWICQTGLCRDSGHQNIMLTNFVSGRKFSFGGGGLCLATNSVANWPNLVNQGFGAGGRSYCEVSWDRHNGTHHNRYIPSANGENGCVIIVNLD